ncbi:MAG TPA: DUF2752 domain-containing protein [Balneolaceae bacterium]
MKAIIYHIFKNYFEILAFTAGLLLLAFMNPHAANGPTLCLFERLGFSFCPGEGLGHSIAFIFQGEIYKSIETNFLGVFAIIILGARIIQLLIKNHYYNQNKTLELWPE